MLRMGLSVCCCNRTNLPPIGLMEGEVPTIHLQSTQSVCYEQLDSLIVKLIEPNLTKAMPKQRCHSADHS